MADLGQKTLWHCGNNCGVRVNAAIAAAIPAIDQLRLALPSMQQYLPPNVYSWGFVILTVSNILLHVRANPAPPPAASLDDEPNH